MNTSTKNMNMNMEMDMSHKSGYFSGHAFAGTGFLAVGCFFLGLTLKRFRCLPQGVSFAEAHIPEKNESVLIGAGLIVTPLALVGICTETGWDNMIAPATHISLYMTTAFVGIVSLLEGMKRLSQDSVRIAIVFAMALQYVLWHEHALMKEVPADFRLHELLAQLCLVIAAIVAYSVKYPENVVAYVVQQGVCVLMGMWLYTGGVYAAFIDIPAGLIGILLVCESFLVALIIVLGAAFLVPRSNSGQLHYYSVPSGDIQETLRTPKKEML